MANEVYKLSLLLEQKNVNPGVVPSFVNDLVKLGNTSKTTKSAYDSLLKSLSRPIADKSGSKLLQTLASIEQHSKKTGTQLGWLKNKADNLQQSASGANKLANAIVNIENRAGKTLSTIERLKNSARGLGDSLPSRSGGWRDGNGRLRDERGRFIGDGGGGDEYGGRGSGLVRKFSNLNENYLEPTRAIAGVWRDNYDSLSRYTDETIKLYRAQGQFKVLNLSERENQKAFSAINKVVRDVRGLSKTDATELFTDVFTTFNDVDAAAQSITKAAKIKVGWSALYGNQYGEQRLNSEIQALYKLMEVTGKNKDSALMSQTIVSAHCRIK